MSSSSILINNIGVTRTLSGGGTESVAWTDIQEVTIVTTDAGPFANDVFWVLAGTTGGCVVPAHAPDAQGLLEQLQRLPDFDNTVVVKAMTSTVEARFVCWRKSTPSPVGST